MGVQKFRRQLLAMAGGKLHADIDFDGTAARTIDLNRETTSATAGKALTVNAGGAVSGGTNLNGGNLILKSGVATGNGSSSVIIQSVQGSQGTGTTDRSPSTVATFLSGTGVTLVGDFIADGTAARTVKAARNTTANTAGQGLTVDAGGATSGATDKAGGNLVLQSGTATGNGGSDVIIKAVDASQGAGTTDRTPTTVAQFQGTKIGFLGVTPASQHAKISDPTGGTTVDAEARTAINAIIDVLEAFGFSAAA